jgi:hypothetical protein
MSFWRNLKANLHLLPRDVLLTLIFMLALLILCLLASMGITHPRS